MKKIVFGLLMTVGMLNAQNNLVFNQVLLFDLSTTTPAIVPEGKVWKIEGFNSGGTNVSSRVSINDNIYYLGSLNTGFNSPTWLPENTEIKKFTSSSSTTFNVDKISVLEFNVVSTSTGTGSGTGGGGVSSDGLVFSEVINQFIPTSSVTGAFGTVAGSFIVPEGKIWKIHNMTHNKISTSTGGFVSLNGSLYVSMDGIPIYGISTNNNVVSNTTANTILTPGTYELKWYQGSGAGSPYYSGTITHLVAIEYNIPQ